MIFALKGFNPARGNCRVSLILLMTVCQFTSRTVTSDRAFIPLHQEIVKLNCVTDGDSLDHPSLDGGDEKT
jgi:hypothetical protein